MPTFVTLFTQPIPLTNLVVTPSSPESSVVLTWTQSALPVGEFVRYRIYRRLRQGQYVWVDDVLVQTTTTYVDYSAPIGESVSYQVTQDNGWMESDPTAGVDTLLPGERPVIVVPGDPEHTFELIYNTGYESGRSLPLDMLEPPGRQYPIVITDLLRGVTGNVDMLITPEYVDIITRIEEIPFLPREWVYFKSPYGDVYKVIIIPGRRSQANGGNLNYSVSFIQVAA